MKKSNKANIIKYIKIDFLTVIIAFGIFIVLFFIDKNYNTDFVQRNIVSIIISFIVVQSLDLYYKNYVYKKNSYKTEIVANKIFNLIPINKKIKIINAEIPNKKLRQIESFIFYCFCYLLFCLFYISAMLSFYNILIGVLDELLGQMFIVILINSLVLGVQLWNVRLIRVGLTYENFPVNFNNNGVIYNKYKGSFKANHEIFILAELQYKDYTDVDLERELIFLNALNNKYDKEHVIQNGISILLAVIAGTLPLVNSIVFNLNTNELNFRSLILYYLILGITIGAIIITGYKFSNYLKKYSKEELYIRIKLIEKKCLN